MIDQRVSEGERINFFGKPALTTTLPAQLSMKYNLNIIPVFIERMEDNKFKIEFQKEINPNNFKSASFNPQKKYQNQNLSNKLNSLSIFIDKKFDIATLQQIKL